MRSRARVTLVTIILIVQVIAVTSYTLVNQRLGDEAVITQMDEILSLATKGSDSMIDAYIADIDRATTNVILGAAQEDETVGKLELELYNALRYVPHLSGAYLAGPDGSFVYVHRTADGYATKRIKPAANGANRAVSIFERDEQFRLLDSRLDHRDEYDPRRRAWYQQAIDAGSGLIWSEPYTFYSSKQPGITRAAQVDGVESGWVVGVDVELSALVGFLDLLSDQISGDVFLQTAEGAVVTREGLQPALALADSPPTGSDAALEARNAMSAASSASGARVEYEFEGETHVARFRQYSLGEDAWTMGLVLSATDVVAPVLGVLGKQRVLILVIGTLAGLLAAALFIPATRPIKRLEHDSSTDSLTRLPNRRVILRRGEMLAGKPQGVTVGMLDIDNFKVVNDTFGHSVGDEVLRQLTRWFAESGFEVGRLGGEEFAFLFPGTDIASAVEQLNLLRARIADEDAITDAGPVRVTVSIGVAISTPMRNFTKTLAAADRALLIAKRSGRNRVVIADETVLMPRSLDDDTLLYVSPVLS